MGTVGDSYDNALAESVEFATLDWVHWFNHRRLLEPIGTGGFMLHPAGLHHYDGSKDGEVIVQITGMGPVKTVDVDAQGNPIGTR